MEVQPTLTSFTPLLASASLLGRFLRQKQGSEVVMDSLLLAMRLYNDFTFRLKAEDMQKQMASLPASDEFRKKLQQQLEALNASIIGNQAEITPIVKRGVIPPSGSSCLKLGRVGRHLSR